MSARTVTAYPWRALESVSRAGTRRAARARRHVQGALDVQRVAEALAELTDSEVSIVVRRVATDSPRKRPAVDLGLELGSSGVTLALALEPELAAHALGRLLRRPIALSSHGTLDDSLTGALTALLLEVARRCNAATALHVIEASEVIARGCDVFVEATLVFAGTPYQTLVAIGLPELPREATLPLSALGELEIALPLVVGCGLVERAMLVDFVPGNAWFPGPGLWLDAHGAGPIALAAASQDRGFRGTLSRDGKIVLRGESVQLLQDLGELMPETGKPDASLTDAVLDSPLVVRVEVGAVSLTAREWAELGPGDIIETGRRIAEPAILRIAGREVARGELVNLEGEIGVRIREIVK